MDRSSRAPLPSLRANTTLSFKYLA